MENLVNLIRSKHPEMAELFLPASTNKDLVEKFRRIDLPDDYYQIYNVVNGEKEGSDGVFGLHRLLPLESAAEQIVEDQDELRNLREKFNYDIFVPIFEIPGRVLIGYAKKGEAWDFAEYDIGTSKSRFAESLSDFMSQFEAKLLADGYATEEGFNGLIDRDEM